MNKIFTRILISGLVLACLTVPTVLAAEISGTLSTPSLTTGLGATVNNCNPLTVSNGTVAAYPSCAITCNSNYTLSSDSCVYTPPSSSGGGSGGAGVSLTPTVSTTTSTTSATSTTPSTSQLQLLNTLIAELRVLLKQAQAQGITLPSGAAQFLVGASSTTQVSGKISFSFNFANDMGIGASGKDVSTLQRVLNALGFTVATSGPGSPGNETTRFGSATRNALKRYQQSVSISATGYLGPLTRASLNALSQ